MQVSTTMRLDTPSFMSGLCCPLARYALFEASTSSKAGEAGIVSGWLAEEREEGREIGTEGRWAAPL